MFEAQNVQPLPISKKMIEQISGKEHGINRGRYHKDKINFDEAGVYGAFALYFNWALNISDDTERERALLDGEFALQDMQIGDVVLEVSEQGTKVGKRDILVKGKPDLSFFEHYESLPMRLNRVDTLEIRRRVYGRIVTLLVGSRKKEPEGDTKDSARSSIEYT